MLELGPKKFRCLEPEPENEFQLHSPVSNGKKMYY